MTLTDAESLLACDVDDLWVFDKLILSRKLGYVCGYVGVDVPTPNYYVVRPMTNLLGMCRGAKIMWLDDNTDHLPLGNFWCEVFTGRNLSVDYVKGHQVLCVEGFRVSTNELYKWSKWERVNDIIQLPQLVQPLVQSLIVSLLETS